MNNLEIVFKSIIQSISTMDEVLSIGRSGGRALPQSSAEGDIDVFVYCSEIPSEEKRRAVLECMGDRHDSWRFGVIAGGGHWGRGDLAVIDGVETWLMYFTTEEVAGEVEAVLSGAMPDKLDNYYYPTGRCAMLAGIEILWDKTGFLSSLKTKLAVYPEELSRKMAAHHIAKLNDTEDLERAVARQDILFYHFALDIALDQFLQALFALNREFFPSRKRSLEYIANFKMKPVDCEKRLLEVVRLGGNPEDLAQSYHLFMQLVEELKS
jgi:hypothetical protein